MCFGSWSVGPGMQQAVDESQRKFARELEASLLAGEAGQTSNPQFSYNPSDTPLRQMGGELNPGFYGGPYNAVLAPPTGTYPSPVENFTLFVFGRESTVEGYYLILSRDDPYMDYDDEEADTIRVQVSRSTWDRAEEGRAVSATINV